MANEWPMKTVAECASSEPYSTQIGPFGKALTPAEYTDKGVPLLRGVNVNHGRFHDDGYVFIGEETADRLSKFESYPGDVLLVHKGTLGNIGLMPKTRRYHRYIMGNSMLRVRCNNAILLPEYLYYWLSSAAGKHYLLSRVSQVGVPQINRPLTTLREARLPVPPTPVQHQIVDVLGKLDDKIELNRRMNRTVEKMAAAIFQSWFIDFDPVHAKAEGRDANLPAEIADLFPDGFEECELGVIPKGWTSGKLADVAENPRRTVQPSDVPPATPYIGLQHMPHHNIALDSWGRADEVASGKSQFAEGEILFGKLRPYFHKVGIAPVDGVCSTDILVVVPKSSEWHSYVLSLVSSKAFVDYTDSHSAGTKMPRTNWKDMGRYPLALPPEPLANAFQDHVAALHRRIGLAVRQNRRLAGLRDTLLPKLLSGEIELPEAEAIAEEVTP